MEDERREEERSKQGQTNNKGKQHSTPKAVTFPRKNELPRVVHVIVNIFQSLFSYLALIYKKLDVKDIIILVTFISIVQ